MDQRHGRGPMTLGVSLSKCQQVPIVQITTLRVSCKGVAHQNSIASESNDLHAHPPACNSTLRIELSPSVRFRYPRADGADPVDFVPLWILRTHRPSSPTSTT